MNDFSPKIHKSNSGKDEIFDPVRKTFVTMTEEEKVRQYMIYLLHTQLNIPLSLMGVEKKITLNGLTKRPDIIAFDSKGKAKIIVECKAPSIMLDDKVIDQVIRYNIRLDADYLIIYNGNNIVCVDCRNSSNKINFEDIRYNK